MLGNLLFKNRLIYTFSDADRDLLVRALYGEAGADAASSREGLAISCTMISRWSMLLALPWYQALLLKDPEAKVYGYDEFREMLAAYSQPVNPRWLNGGRFDHDAAVVDELEKRRLNIQTAPLAMFPPPIHQLVDSVLKDGLLKDGVPQDMAGLVHFYCPTVYYARKLNKKAAQLTATEVEFANSTHYANKDQTLIFSQPAGVSGRSNAFYKIKSTRNWGPGDVKIVCS